MGLALILTVSPILSQAITQNDARKIFEQTVNALNSQDTSSFIALWHLDDSKPWINRNREHTENDVIEDYKDLQNFLVVPLAKKLPFERIEITEMGAGYNNLYKIKAYFKIDNRLQLGYGFLTEYIGGRWALRWHGETTISPNN